jgi:hypothetical protein
MIHPNQNARGKNMRALHNKVSGVELQGKVRVLE